MPAKICLECGLKTQVLTTVKKLLFSLRDIVRIIVFITCSSKKEADRISMAILNKRLAACINLLTSIESKFFWQGKIDKSKETLLLVKTKKSLLTRLIKLVKSLHSYEVPEIIALPIIAGDKTYLEWLDDSTRKSS